MVLLSQSGSTSSDSWEWQTTGGDDLEVDDLDMFDMCETQNVRLLDDLEDIESSSSSEFDSEDEMFEPGKREDGFETVNVRKVISANRGSIRSLQSMSSVPVFEQPKRWKNLEDLATPDLVMGENKGACLSVTAELEAVIKQEEDLNILPPPPLPEDDPAVDWEYQLPAPPSAFRDADSPTLTEGETVVLADTQVFKEPENMDVHLNQAVYRNEVTRVNPLFISQEYDDNPPSKKMELSRTRQISNGEIQHNKQQNESNNRHSRRLYDEDNSREIVAQLKEQQHSVVASRDVKQFNNEIHLRKEQNNETNRNNVEVRVREEPKQYNGLSARSNELSNFTLTTYQRPRLMSDEIFNEGSDEEKQNSLQKSTKLYLHQKFGSTSAINNTSANLSRTNSFNEEEVKPPASVKRSTSYISLIANPVVRTGRSNIVPNRTKSVGNLATEDQAEKTEEQKELQNLQEQFLQLQKQLVQNPELLQSQAPADAPLQSLQVLRSILPQLNQQQNRTTVPPKSLDEELFKQPAAPAMKPSESKPIKDSTNSDKQTSVVTVNNEKRYAYRGPPAVNFTTWSERPKSQVSIKMDGDYRIGVGQGGISEQKDKPAELVKEVATSKPSPAPLTMHLVSHSAAPTVRKPTATVVQKFEEVKAKEPKVASTVGFRTPQHSDPSRVPIVRAVELKKSFIQQQNLHKSTTVLNGDSHVDQRNGEDETFAGVNSLAKRFSFAAPSSNSSRPTRPVSSYSKVENQASSMGIKSVSSTNLNVNTNNDTKSRRYTSVVGIGSDSDHSLSSTSFREPRGPSVVRVNGFAAPKQLMPVVKGFQFAAPAANRDNQPQRSDSMSGIRPRKIEQNHSEESKPEPPPPPPLAASMRKSTARPRPKTLPAAMPNPRDQLMDAIRNFGGREKLRQVCRTQDNVVLIR
ncbi:hypothetical protein C0J52_07486 [Blattella germanica]|nr:hypothetical protein C0J52_07486 [Blattella germanica]